MICPHPVMIDIETLGTAPDAVITSIGAVRFDLRSDWIGQTYHSHIDITESVDKFNRQIDPGTLLWWLDQGDAAKNALRDGQKTAVSLEQALDGLAHFLMPESTPVWCNGASFDFVILRSAYAACGKPTPWPYWIEHCLRTMKNLNRGIYCKRTGTDHHALDDAINQVRLLQRIMQSNKDVDA